MRAIFLTLFALFCFAGVRAQIPNAGFESWDSSAGYKAPVGWDNLNWLSPSATYFSCERGQPGHSGSYYLQLNTRDITGVGLVPGIAVSGKLDSVTHWPVSGFAFSGRPQVLSGVWVYMAIGSDQGYIATFLTRWDTALGHRDTVAGFTYHLPDMVMGWERFALPLNYYNAGMPDSATIFASASRLTAPVNSSFFWLDDLSLTDSVTLQTRPVPHDLPVQLTPNPATDHVTISFVSGDARRTVISVSDAAGRVVFKTSVESRQGLNSYELAASLLRPGIYTVTVSGALSYSGKLLINPHQ